MRVSLLSRYGTTADLALPWDFYARQAITLPSTLRDLLMLVPSLRRPPTAPVAAMRSLPARSTKLILVVRECTGVLL